jgi:hypothetical protein
MKSTQVNVGVIRDKQGIYMGLLKSKSLNRQLAVCYNSDGKLIVKICIVKEIIRDKKDSTVTLVSPDDTHAETSIALDLIQSIYPIRDFMQ